MAAKRQQARMADKWTAEAVTKRWMARTFHRRGEMTSGARCGKAKQLKKAERKARRAERMVEG